MNYPTLFGLAASLRVGLSASATRFFTAKGGTGSAVSTGVDSARPMPIGSMGRFHGLTHASCRVRMPVGCPTPARNEPGRPVRRVSRERVHGTPILQLQTGVQTIIVSMYERIMTAGVSPTYSLGLLRRPRSLRWEAYPPAPLKLNGESSVAVTALSFTLDRRRNPDQISTSMSGGPRTAKL